MENTATLPETPKRKIVILVEKKDEATEHLLSHHLGNGFFIKILSYDTFNKRNKHHKRKTAKKVDCYYLHHAKLYDNKQPGYEIYKSVQKSHNRVIASVLTHAEERDSQIFDFFRFHYRDLGTVINNLISLSDCQKN